MKSGEKIKEARLAKGMTQEELAIKTNINVRTIQRIENNEVTPRMFTVKTIAAALDIDPLFLANDPGEQASDNEKVENKSMLVWLHLSGFLLLPSIFIWLFERDRIKNVRQHGADVINFQLSMLVILIPCLALGFVPMLIALFTSIVIIINTIRVSNNRPYHYPLTISFVKP